MPLNIWKIGHTLIWSLDRPNAMLHYQLWYKFDEQEKNSHIRKKNMKENEIQTKG